MSEPVTIRRILVALDNSPASLAAAEAAAELAAVLGAELTGLYVEDARLLGVGALPITREFDVLTARSRPHDEIDLERQLRASARRARSALAHLADELGARWSFRVVRGSVKQEILNAATGADLVSLGRFGWSLERRRPLGSTVHTLLTASAGHLLLLNETSRISPPILVLFDGSRAGHAALDLAVRVADRWDAPLTVTLVGDDQDDLREAALDRLGHRRRAATFRSVRAGSADRLAHAVALQVGGLAIVPVTGGTFGEEFLRAVVERVHCPILAIRAEAEEEAGPDRLTSHP